MKKEKNENLNKLKLDRKMKRFLENNFPPFNKAEVISNDVENAVVLLDYGQREPKMRVTVDKAGGEVYSNFRLTETEFLW